MIVIEEISLIISNISTLLIYFIPGYWFLVIFRFLCNKKWDKSIVLLMSCVISYIALSLITLFYTNDNILIVSAISIIINTIIAILSSFIYKSHAFNTLLIKVFHKTVHDDIWHDVFDFENGSNLKVYFRNKDYYVIGSYRISEDKGNDSWFAISGYGKYDKVTNNPIEDSFIDDDSVIMTFKLSDVEHIEIF